jgi:hypothetical protein
MSLILKNLLKKKILTYKNKYINFKQTGGTWTPGQIPISGQTASWLYCSILLSPFQDVKLTFTSEMLRLIDTALQSYCGMMGLKPITLENILEMIRRNYISRSIDLRNRMNMRSLGITFDKISEFGGVYFHFPERQQIELFASIDPNLQEYCSAIVQGLESDASLRGQIIIKLKEPGIIFPSIAASAIMPAAAAAGPVAAAASADVQSVWVCEKCTLENKSTNKTCEVCRNPSPWNCDACTFSNKSQNKSCEMCGTLKK